MLSVFVSYCCHNKLPQTYWLKATPTYLSVCRPEAWIQRAASFWRLHCVLVAQLCLTLCDPMDCSPPHFSVQGILQARILEWIAMPFSKGSSLPRDQTNVSCTACMAGGFSTTEPLGRPIQEGYRLLQLCFSLVNLPFITGRVSTSKPRSVEGK